MPSFAVSAAPPLRPLWPYQYLQRESQAKPAPVGADTAQAIKGIGRTIIDADNLLLSDTLQMSDEEEHFDFHIPAKAQVLRAEDQGRIHRFTHAHLSVSSKSTSTGSIFRIISSNASHSHKCRHIIIQRPTHHYEHLVECVVRCVEAFFSLVCLCKP